MLVKLSTKDLCSIIKLFLNKNNYFLEKFIINLEKLLIRQLIQKQIGLYEIMFTGCMVTKYFQFITIIFK